MRKKRRVVHPLKMIKRKRVDLNQITAGGGVLYRVNYIEIEVLLIKRNGVWDLPKGKLETGENISECAVREVAEEVGIPFPKIEKHLCSTYHEYEERGEKVGKTTEWYLMVQTSVRDMTPQKEEGITELKWIELSEAKNSVGYDNLREVLDVVSEHNFMT